LARIRSHVSLENRKPTLASRKQIAFPKNPEADDFKHSSAPSRLNWRVTAMRK
jgi:hypothetical protein